MQAQATVQNQFINTITQGDCINVMRQMPANSVDFILTDPPYLVNYRDRNGRTIQNDANADWLKPTMREAYRILKMNRVAVMFYGWTKVDAFFAAWKEAGFQPVGHIVFRKTYGSKSRFLSYHHEQAYLLAKGRPPLPKQPLADVMDMPYSGNKLHPTQKPVEALAPLVRSFTLPDELVLDPFAGSGSSCAAAVLTGRRYIGMELDAEYFHQAAARLNRVRERMAAKKRSSEVLIPTLRWVCPRSRHASRRAVVLSRDGSALTRVVSAIFLPHMVGMSISAQFARALPPLTATVAGPLAATGSWCPGRTPSGKFFHVFILITALPSLHDVRTGSAPRPFRKRKEPMYTLKQSRCPRPAALRAHWRRSLIPSLLFLTALPVYAQTGSDPWDNAVNVLKTAFTGTIATGLSLVAIVVGGLMFAYGEGQSKKTIAGIVFGVGMAIGAVNFMSWLFPS